MKAANDETAKVLDRLNALSQRGGDTEVDHVEADQILSDFVRSLGYVEIADAFDRIEKWYA